MKGAWCLITLAIAGCGETGVPTDLAMEDGTTLPPTCSDNTVGGDETDVDCGGSCSPCSPGKRCLRARDCDSSVCANNQCARPACSDGVRNGSGSDIDCGGSCQGCTAGKSCILTSDCISRLCVNNICQIQPHCG